MVAERPQGASCSRCGAAGKRVLLWAACVLFVCAMVPLVGRLRAPTLIVVGCDLMRSDGSCLPSRGAGETLRLWLDIPAKAQVEIFNGLTRLNATESVVDQGRLFVLPRLDHYSILSVHVREKPLSWRWRLVRFTERDLPSWLSKAWSLYEEQNRRADADRILKAHWNDWVSKEARARMLDLAGHIASEELRSEDARKLFQKAIIANEAAGLLSDAIEDRLWLVNLWLPRRELGAVEQIMDEAQTCFSQVPEMEPWESVTRAILASLRGDLHGALRQIDSGRAFAWRTGNLRGIADLDQQGVMVLALLGRKKAAQKLIDEMKKLSLTGCRLYDMYRAEGWLHLQAAEAGWADRTSGEAAAARAPLEEALKIVEPSGSCSQPRFAALTLTHLGQVAARAGDVTEAKRQVEAAKQMVTVDKKMMLEVEDVEMTVDWQVMNAEAALADDDLATAEKLYQDLATWAGATHAYYAGWRAAIGLAQVAERQKRLPAALAFYQSAEEYLDRRSLAMPLAGGQVGHLGLYTRGTALYVDLLERMNRDRDPAAHRADLRQAVKVIRHARARGLRGLVTVNRVSQLPPAQLAKYNAALDVYAAVRHELDAQLLQLIGLAEDQRQLRAESNARLDALAMAKFDEALRILDIGSAPAAQLRGVGSQEALLVCHPAKTDWLCFLETTAETLAQRIPALTAATDPSVLAAQLLVPFTRLLDPRHTKQLRVIAYGPMREIDFHLLPWGPQAEPLWKQISVVYAADLGPVAQGEPPVPPGKKSAFLLFDVEGNLPNLRDSAPAIASSLQSEYEIASVSRAVPAHGLWIGQPTGPRLHRTDFLQRIAQATLFHHATHFDFSPSGGFKSSIRLADESGLMVADVLTLPRVPRYVTLFGCNTARSTAELGDTEELGLAQAFLARGSRWAIGTVREVGDNLAANLSQKFFAHLAQAGDPHAALRAAVEESGVPIAAYRSTITPENDLGAFRVYVP